MQLQGKTVLFLGSSVTYGSAAGGVSFADMMAETCGIKMIKEAVSGTTLADINDQSYVSRLKKVDRAQQIDLFICQLSTNDPNAGAPLSETEEAIRFIVEYVRDTFACPIVFYTGTYFASEKYAEMVELLKRLSREYGFAVLNLWDSQEMRAVSDGDYKRYMRDPVHPTLEGYREWWLPKFIEICEGI